MQTIIVSLGLVFAVIAFFHALVHLNDASPKRR